MVNYKYVYKNENGLAFVDQEVSILSLASMEDVKEKMEEGRKFLELEKKAFGEAIRSIQGYMQISKNDVLVLKEGQFYWDEKKNEYINHEENQSFDYPLSWSPDEVHGFAEILISWIGYNDHVYDLYEYLRDAREDKEFGFPTEYTEKFERLFHKWAFDDGESDSVKLIFEKAYARKKEEERSDEDDLDEDHLIEDEEYLLDDEDEFELNIKSSKLH